MTLETRRLPILLTTMLAVALSAVACASGSTNPSASATAVASLAPTSVPTPVPSAVPGGSGAPTASASAATACTALPAALALPTDRFTGVEIASGPVSDRLTFVFGNASLEGQAVPPQGALSVARPPYSQAGSGAKIDMAGDHVLQLTFSGMSLQNDAGEEAYGGVTELTPGLRTIQQAVLYDASEGVIGWYIGYDGAGCVTLGDDGSNVTLTFDHA